MFSYRISIRYYLDLFKLDINIELEYDAMIFFTLSFFTGLGLLVPLLPVFCLLAGQLTKSLGRIKCGFFFCGGRKKKNKIIFQASITSHNKNAQNCRLGLNLIC